MLKDADLSSFAAIYVVCGFTDMRYGIDSLAAMIEAKCHLPIFVPGTLFMFCGRRSNRIKGHVLFTCHPCSDISQLIGKMTNRKTPETGVFTISQPDGQITPRNS